MTVPDMSLPEMFLGVDTLSLKRGDAQVLCDVTATLKRGEITAIVGPNGAGKSSLLMALAGLLKPSHGAAQLGGANLAQIPAQQRAKAIGYLPQGADIAWDVAVEALVALGRMPFRDGRTAEGEAAIEAAIAALDLEALRTRPVGQLSGGETARVLLARVLAGQPQWILADEPLAALDLSHQMRLIGHLKTCAEAGTGVVIVLHDLALAMNHADRVLVLDQGNCVATGAPSEALRAERIEQVWGVKAEWIDADVSAGPKLPGPKLPGQRALITSAL